MSEIVKDEHAVHQGLAIVEAYEQFINYLYPILQNAPRKHGIARDMALRALFEQVELFIAAAKSPQVSRLYSADAHLAALRFWLRFMVDPARRMLTPHQHRAALALLASVGKRLGAWIKSVKIRG
ncbi:diversity-generating retroelement protein Avd [Methylovirgula sp. HY1]|uniref:diversity-generating retroelement protein Avd n=1 Tax=Methylovirgula sp. HY1 TaxID=2822761 RepID=UPI001C78042B|nr:diversity-generating retroelement protein Avd [Methylovirgula sp. HY1]QXX74227.1 hypothetical protein MHY1_01037 [Methylovirgula sp. HY1]